jgi:lactate dehydrogenase-like 2-hydroxyacid dehydrogenase
LFYLMGNLRYYDDYVKQGSYTRSNLFTHHGRPFHELAGRQYGIIGLGSIGKRVAYIASAFGANILYYSTTRKNLNSPYRHVPLNELLKVCDIISIHCPLTTETRNLIGYEQLRMMKKQAILINAGRGGIINETDLARALNEDLLGGAGLDVLEKEPPDANNPLFHIANPEKLFITPHIAWASIESRDRLMEGIIRNITAYLTEKENLLDKNI